MTSGWLPFRYARALVRMFKRFIAGKRPLLEIEKRRSVKLTRRFVKLRIRQERYHARNANRYQTYIVGSDQVWRHWRTPGMDVTRFFLDFVNRPDARRIAYAASFGRDNLADAGLAGREEEIRPLLEQFDAISVREASGVAIIKDTWGLDAAHVLDPTLLLTCADYSALIDAPTSPLSETKPVFYYMLDMTPAKMELVAHIANNLKSEAAGICPDESSVFPPVEQWLKGFRDSEFVITDSFHGAVFCIINRKPFLVIANERRGITRVTSLLDALDLEDRMVREEAMRSFDSSSLGVIDFDAVHAKLDKLRAFSGGWLLAQLKKPTATASP